MALTLQRGKVAQDRVVDFTCCEPTVMHCAQALACEGLAAAGVEE